MLKQLSSHCAVALLVGFLGCGICLAEEGSPVQKLIGQLSATDKQTRRDAASRLGKMGEPAKAAIPALLKALDDPDRQVTSDVLNALADLGPVAKDAIPVLVEDMDSRKVHGGRGQDRQQSIMRASYALSRIGPAAVPALRTALGGDDTAQRRGAAMALGGMGPSAHEAIPELLNNLGHKDADVQREVVVALAAIGPEAVRPAMAAMGGNDPRVRQGAALVLSAIGKPAQEAGAKLAELAEKEPDAAARAAALTALNRVGVEPSRSVPLLIQALRSGDEPLRHAAVNALAFIRAPQVTVPALQGLLADSDPAIRDRAAHTLSRLGTQAAPATAALVACAKAAPDDAVFTDALSQIGEAALPLLLHELSAPASAQAHDEWVFRALRDMGSSAQATLVEGLHSPAAPIRSAAARALGDTLIESPVVIKTLSSLAADPAPDVRAAALRTLATVRSERDATIPKLEAALQDPAPQVHKAAAAGLAAIGAVAKIDVSGLIELLGDAEPATQLAAARALGERGPAASGAVAALTARLDNPALQATAAEALGQIGAAAEPAMPRLLELAKGPDRESRISAFKAIGGIGRPAAVVLPVLYDGMKEEDREVRLMALTALTKVETDSGKLLPILLKSLQEDSGRLRRVAAAALKPMGEKAQAAVPVLVTMLDRETDRAVALDTLRAIHVHDLPPLLAALKNKDAKVRAFACESLGDLGPEAKEAIPALEEKAQGDAEAVREAAKKALARIQPTG